MRSPYRTPSLGWSAVPAGLLFLSAIAVVPAPALATSITIHNADGFNEGFNDPQPVAPVGGNPGTTLGAQRLYLFQYAADTWSLRLGGNLPVIMTASFEPLGGSQFSATLGFAAPTTVHRDFSNAPSTSTWYVAALANQYFGTDLNDLAPQACPATLVGGKCPDLFAQFNRDVDNQTVLGSVDFYYGLDGNGGTDIDFLSVVLHEMGHGLGLLDLIDPATGIIDPNPQSPSCFNCKDAYTNNLVDQTIRLSQMSDFQRKSAILNDGKVVWDGSAVKAISKDILNSGVRPDGAVQIYAPSPYQPGSSIGHLDTDVSPSELMEPFSFNPPPRDLRISLALLEDVGWTTTPMPACGDANGSTTITTADAHVILRGAVGSVSCPEIVCNVNLVGGVSTTDALIVLRYAVGQDIALECPLI